MRITVLSKEEYNNFCSEMNLAGAKVFVCL